VPLPSGVQDAAVTEGPTAVLYLHGFASSPESTKARYCGDRLTAHGVRFACPDFNEPDFRTLTITRMLDALGRAIDAAGGRATLVGSSLGGALAVLAAARFGPAVDRLVLMAPAVMFAKPGHHLLPPERISAWQHEGALPFFHYAYGEERLLDYTFYEDSLRYDPFETVFTQPALVFQGLRDASVDARTVEQFASTRANVTLSLLDDDHQLIASLPRIWSGIEAFLGLVS
jgi:pimeloyl-ACP methyl ester carboxylesterase